MASLSQFTSELRTRDVSKPNMFYVEIAAPNLISSDINSVSMWCDMAHTPQVTILTQDDYIEAGTRRKYAYDQDQSNLKLSFYLDQNYKIKHFFDRWKGLTVSNKRHFGFPSDYTVDRLKVHSINRSNNSTQCYEYLNVFPQSVSATELSYENGANIAKFTVDFVYEDYVSVKYNNGIERRSDDKILVPSYDKDGRTLFPDAAFYDGTIETKTTIPKIDTGQFIKYESIFNDLINTNFFAHNF